MRATEAREYRGNRALRLAAAVLCLVLLTTQLLSGMYARYVTSADASDAARVAKFHITSQMLALKDGQWEESQSFYCEVGPLMEAAHTFKIQAENGSETVVRCVVTLDNPEENLPLVLEVNGKGSDTDSAILAPGGEKEFPLTVMWDKEYTSYKYADQVDQLTVTVRFEQVD